MRPRLAPAARSALLVLAALSPAVWAQGAPSFRGLGDLPGGEVYSHAYGTSNGGAAVVGLSRASTGDAAFRWTPGGGMVSLGDLPGGTVESRANFLSADGAVIVGQSQSANGLEAFRWTEAGGMVGLGKLPGGTFFFSRALSISADGTVVVGESQSTNGFEAFRWQDGMMTGLGDLPGGFFFSQAYAVSADGSVIAGQSQSAAGAEAFRWTAADGMVGLGDLPGGTYFSVVYATSADGHVLAGWGQSDNGIEAFRWTADGGMVGLGDLPGSFFFSVALATSSDGAAVVGYSEAEPQGYRAFLWTAAGGMRNLKDVLQTDYGLDLSGWTLSLAYDLSDDGTTIVGYGTNPSGQTEAWRASGLALGTAAAGEAPEAPSLRLASGPNPARDAVRLSFTLPAPGALVLEVTDGLGRRVATVRRDAAAGPGSMHLSTAGWPAGTYVARLQAGGHSGRLPFTVVR